MYVYLKCLILYFIYMKFKELEVGYMYIVLFVFLVLEDQFLLDLFRFLLFEVSWLSKGKYGILRILVESLKVFIFFQYNLDLVQDIFNNFKEQIVVCYVSVYVDFKIYCFDF